MEKTCETCGKAFNVKPYLADIRRHCSSECKVAANTLTKTCPTCGKEFVVWKSREAKGKGNATWCSKECMVKAKKAAPKPKRVMPDPIYRICEECGSSFRIHPSRVANARWCSKKCQSSSVAFRTNCSESQRGEKSWRWAGGKYAEKRGYIYAKTGDGSLPKAKYEHTAVIIEWLLDEDPEHPFLITVDGLAKLHPSVDVHHIDRDRTNNARSNLLAILKPAHAKMHHTGVKPKPWECWPSNPTVW